MQRLAWEENLYRELTGRAIGTGGATGMIASAGLLAILTLLFLALRCPQWALSGSIPRALPVILLVWVVAGLLGALTAGKQLKSHHYFLNEGALQVQPSRRVHGPGRVRSDIPETSLGCALAVIHFFCGNIYLGWVAILERGRSPEKQMLAAALKVVEILHINGHLPYCDLTGALTTDFSPRAVEQALLALAEHDLAIEEDGRWSLTRHGRETFPDL